MEQKKIDEVLDHINTKFDENVPRLVKMMVRKKMKSLQSFEADSLPNSLRICTVEELIFIVKHGLDTGKLKIWCPIVSKLGEKNYGYRNW